MTEQKGNPNLKDVAHLGSAKTEVGKFFMNLPKFSKDKIPVELLEFYDWVKQLDTKKVDYLLEIKNLYLVVQRATLPAIFDKLSRGETLNRQELDAIKLLKDMMAESHKLKYGDKKVIETVVSVADIRKHMMKDKKVIEAEVVQDDS